MIIPFVFFYLCAVLDAVNYCANKKTIKTGTQRLKAGNIRHHQDPMQGPTCFRGNYYVYHTGYTYGELVPKPKAGWFDDVISNGFAYYGGSMYNNIAKKYYKKIYEKRLEPTLCQRALVTSDGNSYKYITCPMMNDTLRVDMEESEQLLMDGNQLMNMQEGETGDYFESSGSELGAVKEFCCGEQGREFCCLSDDFVPSGSDYTPENTQWAEVVVGCLVFLLVLICIGMVIYIFTTQRNRSLSERAESVKSEVKLRAEPGRKSSELKGGPLRTSDPFLAVSPATESAIPPAVLHLTQSESDFNAKEQRNKKEKTASFGEVKYYNLSTGFDVDSTETSDFFTTMPAVRNRMSAYSEVDRCSVLIDDETTTREMKPNLNFSRNMKSDSSTNSSAITTIHIDVSNEPKPRVKIGLGIGEFRSSSDEFRLTGR